MTLKQIRSLDVKEVGTVQEVKGTVARVSGLPSCIGGQLVTFASDVPGMVIGYEPQEVHVLMLGDPTRVRAGEQVYGRPEPFRIPVGTGVVGRLLNSLAQPIDTRGPIAPDLFYPIFRKAPGITERVPIFKPLETGIKILDTMVPIGKGQRELILGDRMTGKTTLALDIILNQRGKGTICIYCWIGRSYNTLTRLSQTLEAAGALDYSFIVAETASSPVGRQFLVPYSACTLGEYFMEQGKDVLIVFDDLTRHAWIHRQISLLMERPPGREAYPGDMFYIHSQLMERAGMLSPERGGGSMTFLPLVETQQGSVTGHIPSNTISMTDGQVYLSPTLFSEGFRPAIDLGLSVSRIGSKVQSEALRDVSKPLRLEYLRWRELERATKLRTNLSEEATKQLRSGTVLRELLIQEKSKPVDTEEQIVMFYAYRLGALTTHSVADLRRFKREFYSFLKARRPGIIEELKANPVLGGHVRDALMGAYAEFFEGTSAERK